MANYNLDCDAILDEVINAYKGNAAIEYVCEYLKGDKWSCVSDLVSQLQSASCASGSWGADTIYTARILEKLGDESWRDAVQWALDEYADATGESPTFDPLNLESLVTFAVDWASHVAVSYIESHGDGRRYGVAYVAVFNAGSPWEERKAFLFETDADDAVSEAIAARMESEAQHAQRAWTEEEYETLMEQVQSEYYVTEERIA